MSHKVLIADDEEDVLFIMAKKLEKEGYEVITATNGQEAWEKIRSDSPDVIVTDLTMPEKDGLEILKDLRSNPTKGKWQPVIIVSARDELQDMKEGFSLDADHYITKPCSPDDVIKAVRLMISLIPQRKSSED